MIRPSHRLEQLPPYLFAELERKVSERRRAGADVISLGIGDPDLPSPDLLVEEARRWIGDPATHRNDERSSELKKPSASRLTR